jgi:hypothetical protein
VGSHEIGGKMTHQWEPELQLRCDRNFFRLQAFLAPEGEPAIILKAADVKSLAAKMYHIKMIQRLSNLMILCATANQEHDEYSPAL